MLLPENIKINYYLSVGRYQDALDILTTSKDQLISDDYPESVYHSDLARAYIGLNQLSDAKLYVDQLISLTSDQISDLKQDIFSPVFEYISRYVDQNNITYDDPTLADYVSFIFNNSGDNPVKHILNASIALDRYSQYKKDQLHTIDEINNYFETYVVPYLETIKRNYYDVYISILQALIDIKNQIGDLESMTKYKNMLENFIS